MGAAGGDVTFPAAAGGDAHAKRMHSEQSESVQATFNTTLHTEHCLTFVTIKEAGTFVNWARRATAAALLLAILLTVRGDS